MCRKRGPNGPPTYDRAGFQLDYKKVMGWFQPQSYNKSRIVNGMERALEKSSNEEKIMREIFYEKGEAPEKESLPMCAKDAWIDRVSKDLNIPWHKVGPEEFKTWEQKGFQKAKKGEYQEFSDKEKARFLRLHSGCSLRK